MSATIIERPTTGQLIEALTRFADTAGMKAAISTVEGWDVRDDEEPMFAVIDVTCSLQHGLSLALHTLPGYGLMPGESPKGDDALSVSEFVAQVEAFASVLRGRAGWDAPVRWGANGQSPYAIIRALELWPERGIVINA